MIEKSGGGVRAGELRLEERLREYPELRARFEEMLAIVENAAGDIVKADEAEQRVIEELRELGRSALQGGPSASNCVCKRRASSRSE